MPNTVESVKPMHSTDCYDVLSLYLHLFMVTLTTKKSSEFLIL